MKTKQLKLLMSCLLFGLILSPSVFAETNPTASYCTHVQNEGWQSYVSNGIMSGTEGKSYRLEGIKVKLDTQGYDLGVTYQTHIQNIGWEADTVRGWKNDDAMSGTEGLSYRLEAIQMKLTGVDADKFDIYYQVHAQNVGWMGWAKNGESSGTAGYGYRLEGIRIVILPTGSEAPSAITTPAFMDKVTPDVPVEPIDYTVYKTKSGTKYHKDGCSFLSSSKIPLLKSEAIAQGLEPCTICKP